MFYRFKKGKAIYSVPNGIGDGSAYFDGSNYAQIANVDSLPYGGVPRSFSIWVYPTYLNNNSEHYLFAYGSSTSANLNIKIVYGSRISFCGWQYDYPFQINNWYHIVVTYDENKEFKIYCNNELVANRQNWSTDTPKGFAFIGGWYSDSLSYPFYGNLSNLQIFNRALTQDEVTQLYNKQEITSGRVLYVPLTYGKDDETMFTEKSFVYDYSIVETSSGFNAMGKPIGYRSASVAGIAFNTFINQSTVFALNANKGDTELVNDLTPTYNNGTCLEDSTFKFDGDTKWVTYPTKGVSDVNLGTGPFTIEWDCSIGTSHNGTYPAFINMGAVWSTVGCYIIQWQRQGSGRFSSHWNGDMGQDCYPTDAFPQFNGDGLYHHVAITRADDGLYCFWIDGKRLSDTYTRTLPLDLSFANLDFGYNRIDGGRLQYNMKHFRISKECLYTEDFNVPNWVEA